MTANGSSTAYTESFKLEGVGIENYFRTERNHTTQILAFDIVNRWRTGIVNWSITNPSISNSSNLSADESIAVIVEETYTSQDSQMTELNAKASSFTDMLTDVFEIRPLQIFSFETLAESLSKAVFEIVARNNLNSTQYFDWELEAGAEDISSGELTNITSEDVFVIIETNYSKEGVYEAIATLNSSSYNDSEESAVIV